MTSTKLSRSAYGLESGVDDRSWETRGACAQPGMNPDWWSGNNLGRGRHVCRSHCPVQAECERDVLARPHAVAGTVRAGWLYTGTMDEPVVAGWQPELTSVGCPPCDTARARARPSTAACGTHRGPYHHRKAGEPVCGRCLEAAATYERERSKRRRRVS